MTFIDTVVEDKAPDIPNLERAFSHRPDVYDAWRQLNGTIKAGMDLRRYELATVAAARRLRSSYCALAHGSVLAGLIGADTVRAVVTDPSAAGLNDVDLAVLELADKVADDATSVTQADIDRLKALGLSDQDVLDVVLAVAARCFFSTTLDALGVQADGKYADLEPGLRDALTVGRPIAD